MQELEIVQKGVKNTGLFWNDELSTNEEVGKNDKGSCICGGGLSSRKLKPRLAVRKTLYIIKIKSKGVTISGYRVSGYRVGGNLSKVETSTSAMGGDD